MRHARLIVLGCLLAAAGCGGDGESSLDSNQQVNTLSQSELDTFCMQTVKEVESQFTPQQTCTALAVFTVGITGTTQECEMEAQMCVQGGESDAGAGSPAEGDSCFTPMEVASCDATVGEARACLDAQIQHASGQLSQASCDDVQGSFQALTQALMLQSACDPIGEECVQELVQSAFPTPTDS